MLEWGFNDTAIKIPTDDSMGTSNENNINKIDSKKDLRRIWRTTAGTTERVHNQSRPRTDIGLVQQCHLSERNGKLRLFWGYYYVFKHIRVQCGHEWGIGHSFGRRIPGHFSGYEFLYFTGWLSIDYYQRHCGTKTVCQTMTAILYELKRWWARLLHS